jgi:diadenosine tetraphosphate (Ap4A) HIT family hydrolase
VNDFQLDPRLQTDTILVGDARLSRVLLMNDARFPWLILVPRRAGLAELTDLAPQDRAKLMEEVAAASTALSKRRGIEKINVGALGNIVRQLHIHVVGRTINDPAWPGPVWGFGARQPYERTAAQAAVSELAEALVHILTD